MARSVKLKLALAARMAEKMTPAERRLWGRLEDGRLCRPQKLICGYIADFAYPSKRLVIEMDGESHAGREQYDRERDAAMWLAGWRVIRFTNAEVKTDLNRVMGRIRQVLKRRPLPRTRQVKPTPAQPVGDGVQFGCAVRRWKRLHPAVPAKGRLVKK